MAVVNLEITRFGVDDAFVTMTYNNANGSVSRIAWTINRGALHAFVTDGNQVVVDQWLTTSGSVNPAAAFNLVPGKNGSWVWAGGLRYEFQWQAAVP